MRGGVWHTGGVADLDWARIRIPAQVTEAAAVVAACQVVFATPGDAPATYEITVFEALLGDGARYFAVGRGPTAFSPVGNGATPEDALQACLDDAGIHHRRREKQARET